MIVKFKFSLKTRLTEMVQVRSSGIPCGWIWTAWSSTWSRWFESRCHRGLCGATFLHGSGWDKLLGPTQTTGCSSFHAHSSPSSPSPSSNRGRAGRCDGHLLCAQQQQWGLATTGPLTWWSIGSDDGFARSRGGWVLQPHLQRERIRHLGPWASACSLQWSYVWGRDWELYSSSSSSPTCTSPRGGSVFSTVARNDSTRCRRRLVPQSMELHAYIYMYIILADVIQVIYIYIYYICVCN